VKPGLCATAGWLLTAGWWCVWNLQRFGMPFPHQYDLRRAAVLAVHPQVGEPLLYHRPLGWYLPFDPELFATPYAEWPRPNFWVQMVAGTWVDDINHGFCRLTGGAVRFLWGGWLSARCEAVSRQLIVVGVALTLLAAVGCAALLVRFVRSRGVDGSLVVPLVCASTLAVLIIFATKYPFDHHPIVKASYALHIAAPLCACVGWAVDPGLGSATRLRNAGRVIVCAAVALAIAAVSWLVAIQLWGG
jgi:hypothetical protein